MKCPVTVPLSRGLQNRGRLDTTPKEQLNLDRLRARIREKPRTKLGQVKQAWPEIRGLFAAGHSLKDIWTWVNESGIEIGYARLCDYIGRMQRGDASQEKTAAKPIDYAGATDAQPKGEPNRIPVPQPLAAKRRQKKSDPIVNIIEREQQPPGFSYNSDPDVKKLI